MQRRHKELEGHVKPPPLSPGGEGDEGPMPHHMGEYMEEHKEDGFHDAMGWHMQGKHNQRFEWPGLYILHTASFINPYRFTVYTSITGKLKLKLAVRIYNHYRIFGEKNGKGCERFFNSKEKTSERYVGRHIFIKKKFVKMSAFCSQILQNYVCMYVGTYVHIM